MSIKHYLDFEGAEFLAGKIKEKQNIFQIDTMPTPSAEYLDKVYQYIGATTATYKHNMWYECISDGETPATYSWIKIKYDIDIDNVLDSTSPNPVANSALTPEILSRAKQLFTIPTPSLDYLDSVVQYIGATTGSYTHGWFYECISDGEPTPTYSWVNVPVQEPTEIATASTVGVVKPGDGLSIDNTGTLSVVGRLQEISALPIASASLEGTLYLLTSAQMGYTKGNIYECQEILPSTDPKTYQWVAINDKNNYTRITNAQIDALFE